jgi:putative aldouronate transport system permease protein
MNQGILCTVIFIFSAICIVPLVLVLAISLTNENVIFRYGFSFIPRSFSLSAYKAMFYPGSSLVRGYGISLFITLVGTIVAVTITYMAAFSLANKRLAYRNWFALFFFIVTVFNAGLVPWYLICKALGLHNNLWALIIPSMIFTPFNMFLVRNFIRAIPDALMESARLDGSGELRIAFQIYFPLCLPVIATISLFYAISYWNNWFNAVMLLDNSKYYPLQMVLFKIQSDINMLSQMTNTSIEVNPPRESFKMASAVVAMGPIVLLYPFLQRYFIKGMIVGSIKG